MLVACPLLREIFWVLLSLSILVVLPIFHIMYSVIKQFNVDIISIITTNCDREPHLCRLFPLGTKGVLFKALHKVQLLFFIEYSTESSNHDSTFLTVFMQSFFSISSVLDVPPSCFSPPPKVPLQTFTHFIGDVHCDALISSLLHPHFPTSCSGACEVYGVFKSSLLYEKQIASTKPSTYPTCLSWLPPLYDWSCSSSDPPSCIESESVSTLFDRLLYFIYFVIPYSFSCFQ